MRQTWWLASVVFSVALIGHSTSVMASKGQPQRHKPAPKVVVQEPRQVEKVTGFGRDRDTAVFVAEKFACERVRQMLLVRYGEDWLPPERLLAPEALKQLGAITLEGEPTVHPDLQNAPEGDAKLAATYQVELPESYLREVRSAAREVRVQSRHALLLRVLGGAVVMLLVTAAYLRLEEWTRGYATRILRIAAGVIVLLAAGLLWATW